MICLCRRWGCVCLFTVCALSLRSPVTLSRFLMFHLYGVPVAECIVNFSLLVCWFSFFHNKPRGRAIRAQPAAAFAGSPSLKHPLCAPGKLFVGGGSRTVECCAGFSCYDCGFKVMFDPQNDHLQFQILTLCFLEFVTTFHACLKNKECKNRFSFK